jgi:hypothetical protein
MHKNNSIELFKQDIFFGNIQNLKNNLGFLELIEEDLVNNISEPFFIWTGTNSLNLNKIKIENVKNAHLHFYLYEPSCYYHINNDVKFNKGFYNEFLTIDSFDNIRSEELDSIHEFAKQNGLNITVHTGDYNVKLIKHNYPSIKIDCSDLFLVYMSKLFSSQNKNFLNDIEHKFWCGNWRYTPHRQLTAAFLTNFDSKINWHLNVSNLILPNVNWVDKSLLELNDIQTGLDNLKTKNYSLEIKTRKWRVSNNNEVVIPNKAAPPFTKGFEKTYYKCFCTVITETRYAQPFSNISEKTFYSMLLGRPFILVAPPYSLEYIKKLGFLTFENFWDESYDRIENHSERLHAIFKLINDIDKLSINDLKILLDKMKDILEFNMNRVKEFHKKFVTL